MESIKIRGIEIVKGKNVIPVEHYIDHFSKQNKDVEILLRYVFGREAICLADENETSLTMSLEACLKVLESTETDIKDIDMVIFSGLLPEHLMPQTALILHNKLDGKKDCLCFDMNSDCIGMISALELVRGYFNGTNGKSKALIVGCDDVRVLQDEENPLTYGVYGNVACATIVEKCTSDESYIIDNSYGVTHPASKGIPEDSVLYPEQGLYKVLSKKGKVPASFKWEKFDSDGLYEDGRDRVKKLLEKNNIEFSEVSLFCLSQLSFKYVSMFREVFDVPEEKCPYVVSKCGYTGTSSPFLVLYDAIKNNKIKRGDIVVMWTLGMGSDDICTIFKY